MSSLRVWERRAVDVGDGSLELPLRFRVVPGVWPEIELAPADGTRADVTAAGHEIRIVCDTGEHGTVLLDVAGFLVALVGRTVTTTDNVFVIPGSGAVEIALVIHGRNAALTFDGAHEFTLTARPAAVQTALPVTENVTGFRFGVRPPDVGRLETGGGAQILDATVWGLREARSAVFRTTERAIADAGRTFYASGSFRVADRWVSDGDDPPALVADGRTIVSPIRVIEEFAWRDTPYGDMPRVADRQEMWRSVVEPGRFPRLESGFRSVDATFELAMETFQRNSSAEFALPGETGLWSAGYFQGSGLGFGSWRRDTSHVALRTGNLVDPEVARASLVHVVTSGFDNGSDGDVLPAVAVWDHYLATGDASIVDETWSAVSAMASALDARFDGERGLIVAPQSTSNDLVAEPEAGGFALSTEIYAAETYRALARMGELLADPRAGAWAARAAAMRDTILEQYWNPELGYFTSGPVGTDAHAMGVWETSGAEAALWFLGVDESRTRSTLEAMQRVAMSEYGVVLYPHRDEDNHFCHSVWYCWQAGLARAAAGVGDAALVRRLIAQQVRTVVLNKTFYEVTDARDGASWRWPGQLWHAAGFVSMVLYGVYGTRYDEVGMSFAPAVAPEFDGARLDGLRYRAATLDVVIQGSGTRCSMTMDGQPVDRVDAGVAGRHSVVLTMRG
ncbi:MAG: hypothetical protein ACTHKX_10430 [Pseudolysinimonas sp.]